MASTMTERHTADYLEYLKSDEWRERAARARALADYKCQKCGVSDIGLEVHHITYDNLGAEEDADLQALCPKCHKIADAQRARKTANERRERAFQTYARKRWGEYWEEQVDEDEARDTFDTWMEYR